MKLVVAWKQKLHDGLKENDRKPVVGFIAGQTAPPGRRMGHAGAIIGGADDTAAAKMKIMKNAACMLSKALQILVKQWLKY